MSLVQSLSYFKAEIALLIGAFVVLFMDFAVRDKKAIGITALVALGVSALFLRMPSEPLPLFNGFFMLDPLTHFFRITALAITAVGVLISLRYEDLPKPYLAEYYALLLFSGFGLILMAAANNLLMIFLAIESVSLVSYLLTGFLKSDKKSKEASLKYLLFGSVASGLMLYGMSILYGLSGSIELDLIRGRIANPAYSGFVFVAMMLVLGGIGFKISMAPFHLWAPDVYEGAPTPFTAFLTVGPKAAGFALLIRVLSTSFPDFFASWTQVILLLSVITMTLGNVIAIAQDNIKRLLAYSSIAQAGYILMGIAVFTDTGLQAVLLYLAAYAFTNLGAFAVVLAVTQDSGSDQLSSFAGLGKRSPMLAASMTIFLLSLAGIPPLAGFMGKFMVFAGTIQKGYIVLAVAAAINSAIAAFYYFKVVRQMYLVPAENEKPLAQPLSLSFALYLMLAGTIALGLVPMPLLSVLHSIIPLS
ncbi:MAG TPA: NADH-quinone oxidoreductase subunit N [Verrucomicrobiae bacterium]|nr:NADH-quinone oxidoreductase subunit N [Verrucomicrobiae bacterium]